MKQRNEGLEHYLACHVMDCDYDPRGDSQSEIASSCFARPTDWLFDGNVYYCPECDGIALYDKKGRQELSYYCPSCGRYMFTGSM